MSRLRKLQEDVREHILKNTVNPDEGLQREKQKAAVEAHEAARRAEAAYLDSLIDIESEPISHEPLRHPNKFLRRRASHRGGESANKQPRHRQENKNE